MTQRDMGNHVAVTGCEIFSAYKMPVTGQGLSAGRLGWKLPERCYMLYYITGRIGNTAEAG